MIYYHSVLFPVITGAIWRKFEDYPTILASTDSGLLEYVFNVILVSLYKISWRLLIIFTRLIFFFISTNEREISIVLSSNYFKQWLQTKN